LLHFGIPLLRWYGTDREIQKLQLSLQLWFQSCFAIAIETQQMLKSLPLQPVYLQAIMISSLPKCLEIWRVLKLLNIMFHAQMGRFQLFYLYFPP
jgi:hypothetical protein